MSVSNFTPLRIFVKILPQMYLRTRKNSFNFGVIRIDRIQEFLKVFLNTVIGHFFRNLAHISEKLLGYS